MIAIRSVLDRLIRPDAPARAEKSDETIGHEPLPGAAARPDLARVLTRSAIVLVSLALSAAFADGNLFTLYQVKTQDQLVLLALPPVFLLLRHWVPGWRLPHTLPPVWMVLAAGCFVAALLAWCCHTLLWNFPLSRDEHMVVFDMAVYEDRRLAAPLAPEWRDYALALVPEFLFNESEPIGLVSGYLPVNALFRLAFAQLADPALLNPLLAVMGAVALFDIAKRLFGNDSQAIWVALLVYALSAQSMANALTPYAMTGHMALNLCWLAAFLRGGWRAHVTAIVIGFFATGYHQLAFHPLFAAPFVLWRLRQGAWPIVALYAAAYTLIVAWWMAFPLLTALQAGTAAADIGLDHHSFAEKVIPLLVHRDPLTLQLMMLNLLRFVSWQHLALLPLVLAAVPLAWRDRGLAAPLLWGVALNTAFMAFVLPYQGNGWGYRYLQPQFGSIALLAGVGFQHFAAVDRARVEGMFVALSLLTLLGSIPLHALHQRVFYRPHVALDRYITSRSADFVVVNTEPRASSDGTWGFNPVDEVRNRPDLDNRPLVFSSRALSKQLAAELCRRGSVGVVDWDQMHAIGFGPGVSAQGRRIEDLKRVLERGGCLVSSGGRRPILRRNPSLTIN
jgi:hypothetical protein